MILPNKWGQGALFAFSALDGVAQAEGDFSGTLCGDKIGIRFYPKVRRELVLTGMGGSKASFEVVTGDSIVIATKFGKMMILFANAHTVIGTVADKVIPRVFTEGICREEEEDGVLLQDTLDGEVTALSQKNGHFAFAFGTTPEEATERALLGLEFDPEQILNRNLLPFSALEKVNGGKFEPLLAKCLSVMKTQLYSPEGVFRQTWSTPDRLPHKRLWLWDSVFHAIGFRNLDPSLAQDLILSALDCQREDGFIPHMALPNKMSAITQPPVLAWGALAVYEKSRDKAFLKRVFRQNKAFLRWCMANRRDTDEALFVWLTGEKKSSRCDECGMDNSPRFDLETRLQAIDFSCFMANEARCMAKIARLLEDEKEQETYESLFCDIRSAVNEKLYCAEDGFYYDFDLKHNRLHKVLSVASFLPLFAGIASPEQAARLAGHLQDPETFFTPFPIPSVSRKDATYGSDMWRGPVWLNYNYMILAGLKEYGFSELFHIIRDKTLSCIDLWYQRKGVLFEFYDPENLSSPSELNRKGPPLELYDFGIKMQAVRDFGWTTTLVFDLLFEAFGT